MSESIARHWPQGIRLCGTCQGDGWVLNHDDKTESPCPDCQPVLASSPYIADVSGPTDGPELFDELSWP